MTGKSQLNLQGAIAAARRQPMAARLQIQSIEIASARPGGRRELQDDFEQAGAMKNEPPESVGLQGFEQHYKD